MTERNLDRILFFLAATFLAGTIAPAQESDADQAESAAEEVKSKAESVMSDPRLRNVFRSVEEKTREVTDSVDEDTEEKALREATRLFQEQKKTLESGSGDLPVSEGRMKEAADTARSAIEDAVSPEPSDSDVPATRSASSNPPVARPVDPDAADSPDEPSESVGSDSSTGSVVQDQSVEAAPDTGPTAPSVPDSPLLAETEVPEPRPLQPRYKTQKDGGYRATGEGEMEITSKESVMDNKRGVLTFRGNVVVNHPQYNMICDKLEIHLAEGATNAGSQDGSSPAFKRGIATGGMVEIRRVGAKGKTQIALARRAEYIAASGDITLSGGPPYLQDGDRFIETTSEDARIIMRGDGKYEITGSDAGDKSRNRIVIPVKGGDQSQDIGIGSGLGGSIEDLR